jgi:hypothetical protein
MKALSTVRARLAFLAVIIVLSQIIFIPGHEPRTTAGQTPPTCDSDKTTATIRKTAQGIQVTDIVITDPTREYNITWEVERSLQMRKIVIAFPIDLSAISHTQKDKAYGFKSGKSLKIKFDPLPAGTPPCVEVPYILLLSKQDNDDGEFDKGKGNSPPKIIVKKNSSGR